MNSFTAKELLYSEKHTQLPSVNFLLKISLGLILLAVISSALAYAETISVDVEGTSFDIEYVASGMSVTGIEVDTDFVSLILTVDVTESSGTLDITLDRSFFDFTFEGLDDDFFILADGDETNFSETDNTIQSRTLSVELPAGTEEVEIFGFEFGVSVPVVVPDTSVDDDAVAAAAAQAAADAQAVADAQAAADAQAVAADATIQVDDTPSAQCGPGTVLKDGACVLDERCGPGTVLKDGACVLDSTSQSSSSMSKGMGKEAIMGVIIAFVGAGIVAVVFGIIARASKSS